MAGLFVGVRLIEDACVALNRRGRIPLRGEWLLFQSHRWTLRAMLRLPLPPAVDNPGLPRYPTCAVTLAQRADWGKFFDLEARLVARCLGDLPHQLHHIGSTAVPGLLAKPTIDILLVVERERDREVALVRLAGAGYRLVGNRQGRGGVYLEKVQAKIRTHAVQMHLHGDPATRELLQFRERLSQDAAIREQYEGVKRRLAFWVGHDRAKYAWFKSHWIDGTILDLRSPEQWAGNLLAKPWPSLWHMYLKRGGRES